MGSHFNKYLDTVALNFLFSDPFFLDQTQTFLPPRERFVTRSRSTGQETITPQSSMNDASRAYRN